MIRRHATDVVDTYRRYFLRRSPVTGRERAMMAARLRSPPPRQPSAIIRYFALLRLLIRLFAEFHADKILLEEATAEVALGADSFVCRA